MQVRILDSREELAEVCADLVAEVIASRPSVRLVLAGGTTPRRTYELLGSRDIAWGRVSVLFGDERCVAPSDDESNYRMAAQALLAHAIPASVSRIPAELGPDRAAALYEPIVAAAPLDLVLLGMGPDGHVASLFPEHEALRARSLVVGVRDAPKQPPRRVTLTLRALRAAHRVVVLVSGADKATAFRAAREGRGPAGLLTGAEWLITSDVADDAHAQPG